MANIQSIITNGNGNVLIGTTTDNGAVFKVGIGGGDTGAVTTEWFRVNLNGNVGIGTTAPTATLDARIAGTTSGAVIKVGNVGSGDFGGLAVSDGGTYPVQLYGSSLAFLTGNSAYASATEKVRITSGGNVLINTTTDAGYKLDVSGTGRFTWGFINKY
jgi:hypothetical protein